MDTTMNPKRKETVNVELSDTIWHTGNLLTYQNILLG